MARFLSVGLDVINIDLISQITADDEHNNEIFAILNNGTKIFLTELNFACFVDFKGDEFKANFEHITYFFKCFAYEIIRADQLFSDVDDIEKKAWDYFLATYEHQILKNKYVPQIK